MNYAELVRKNCYFIDKTKYIMELENVQNPVYLRPRRFGKSLFCSMLQYYYDLKEADRFHELFGHTWIGKNPTGNQNSYIVLKFDLSVISVSDDISRIEYNFNRYCNGLLSEISLSYPKLMEKAPEIRPDDDAATNLVIWLGYMQSSGAPAVYVIIDEYDNFANQLIIGYKDGLYHTITGEDSFLRSFFKVLKAGRQTGSIENIFITGVLPITIDDLTSGYNIAKFITLDPGFEQMMGFTQEEVDRLLYLIFHDYGFNPAIRPQVSEIIKSQYNGYHFVRSDGDAVYNSTMLMFFWINSVIIVKFQII